MCEVASYVMLYTHTQFKRRALGGCTQGDTVGRPKVRSNLTWANLVGRMAMDEHIITCGRLVSVRFWEVVLVGRIA